MSLEGIEHTLRRKLLKVTNLWDYEVIIFYFFFNLPKICENRVFLGFLFSFSVPQRLSHLFIWS